ncbi:unnamed protein product [Rhizophagus irregularis]|uniref:Uncharacterized protein n=1 Tax=Rhizophagus irregularis TaxID=588596 RepID=A0A916EGW9_9GLOM|nr:unnamed protein product [Rhizophagus irregularis]
MPVETTHRTLDNKVLPDETSFVIIKKLSFVSGKRREKGKTKGKMKGKEKMKGKGKTKGENESSGGLPTNGKLRFVSFGWASEEGKPRNQDSFRVAFRRRKTKKPRFVSFGWASEEGKPRNQDS